MSSRLYYLISSLFLLLLIAVGMIAPAPVGSAQQAQQERRIEKKSWPHEPIKILKLKTKGKDFELSKNFLEDDDWLRGLTVSVKNVSDKQIARIEFHLSFPRPEGTNSEEVPVFVISMIYGQEPSSDLGNQKYVLPGENVDVKLLEANLPFIKAALKNLGYPEKITRAQIVLDSVTFGDGTTWAGNTTLYPDPDNPGQKKNPLVPKTP